jgi:hypothetical protein
MCQKFVFFPKREKKPWERYVDALLFKPQRYGRLSGVLNVGSCEIEVSVAWSRVEWCY